MEGITFQEMELWKKNLFSLWIAQFIASMGLTMVVPFLPLYLGELGVTGGESVKIWSGLLFSAPFMVSAFLQPFWGIMGDRWGRKPMVVRAMLGLGLANILMGFSRTAPQLFAFRLFQGCLSGFVAPSLALMASCTPPERTGQALGTLQSAMVSGFTVGPFLGGLLAHFMGYRPIFFWTGSFCLAAGLIVLQFTREEFKKKTTGHSFSLMPNIRYIFRSPELRFMLVLLILTQFAIQIVTPFLSLYVEYLKASPKYVALLTGLVFGITGVANAITAPFWGKRADRTGYHKILRASLIGMIVFYIPQAMVSGVFQLMIFRAGLGVFTAGVLPIINTMIRGSTEEKDRGGIYGIFQSGILFGNLLGPLMGGVLSAHLGLRPIFLVTASVVVFVYLWEKKLNRTAPTVFAVPR